MKRSKVSLRKRGRNEKYVKRLFKKMKSTKLNKLKKRNKKEKERIRLQKSIIDYWMSKKRRDKKNGTKERIEFNNL